MPPSPVLTTLRGWKEKQATSACGLPIFSHSPFHMISLPIAQAASSTTGMPCRRPMATSAARSHGMPIWWTHRMARVFGVIAASTSAGSMLKVRGSMSTNTGVAPQYLTLLAVAMYEWLTVTTSSPAVTPATIRARWSAVVQFETAQAWGAPTYSANSRSNAATSGPCVIHPLRMTRRAASASASPIKGLAIAIMCAPARIC